MKVVIRFESTSNLPSDSTGKAGGMPSRKRRRRWPWGWIASKVHGRPLIGPAARSDCYRIVTRGVCSLKPRRGKIRDLDVGRTKGGGRRRATCQGRKSKGTTATAEGDTSAG